MAKKGKKRKTIRQTNRNGSLKSSIGSVDTENSYTPAEAPPTRRQNTGQKKITTTP